MEKCSTCSNCHDTNWKQDIYPVSIFFLNTNIDDVPDEELYRGPWAEGLVQRLVPGEMKSSKSLQIVMTPPCHCSVNCFFKFPIILAFEIVASLFVFLSNSQFLTRHLI